MKKIALIVSMLLLIVSFSGCDATQSELYSKIKQTNAWKSTEMNMSGSVSVAMSDESFTLDMGPIGFKANGYMNTNSTQGYMEITFENKADSVNIPAMKMFIDKSDIYMNKDYFTQIFELNGKAVPQALQNLDADYICLGNSLENVEDLMADPEYINIIYSLYEELATDLGLDIPVTKEGTAYTISLDENKSSDLIVKVVENFVANIDSLNTKYNLGLTQEDINGVKSGFNKEEVSEAFNELKTIIAGSNIKVTYDFKDDNNLNSSINIKMPINIPETADSPAYKLEINMTANADSKQIEERKIELPSKVARLTYDELLTLTTPDVPQQ